MHHNLLRGSSWLVCDDKTWLTQASCPFQVRKELTQGRVKDQHWNWGSLLLGLGVVISLAGPINTYIRLGQSFAPVARC